MTKGEWIQVAWLIEGAEPDRSAFLRSDIGVDISRDHGSFLLRYRGAERRAKNAKRAAQVAYQMEKDVSVESSDKTP